MHAKRALVPQTDALECRTDLVSIGICNEGMLIAPATDFGNNTTRKMALCDFACALVHDAVDADDVEISPFVERDCTVLVPRLDWEDFRERRRLSTTDAERKLGTIEIVLACRAGTLTMELPGDFAAEEHVRDDGRTHETSDLRDVRTAA